VCLTNGLIGESLGGIPSGRTLKDIVTIDGKNVQMKFLDGHPCTHVGPKISTVRLSSFKKCEEDFDSLLP
jgi:hypothetical protein